MNDLDIRLALLRYLKELHGADPSVRVVEEVCVCQGRSRVDLAVVGQELHGYEIKSQKDTLSRLAGQLEDYRAVFHEVTVVIGLKHLSGVLATLPSWCGVILAHRVAGEVTLEPFRPARANLHRDPFSLACLLWRDEGLAVLERHGQARGVRSKPREAIWRRLAESLSLQELDLEVRVSLLRRTASWRGAARPTRRRRGASRSRSGYRRRAAS